ncbi:transposase [Limosilactobacillus fermentum]|uniref:transposase n=1 Tax=Limosilactobacillus fermentum TaxID=1613 RepID=UPI0013B46492|nr:transposase [Limosilactobacillus fermentum]
MFNLVVKHILPGMGLFFYFVLHFNCKFAPLLKHYQTQLPTTDILVRGDSGFATPEVYDVCEANDVFYIIRLKRNRKLQNLAEKFVKISDQTQWQEKETHYYSEIYQSASWPKPRQIYIKSTRVAGELIFSHEFIVTNLTNLTAETAFELYHKRSQMENYIKDLNCKIK